MTPARPELPGRQVFLALTIVSLAVLYGAREYLLLPGASAGDDASSHLAEHLYTAELFRQGETDFWCPIANLGYPLFTNYQPLVSAVQGALVALFSGLISAVMLYKLAVVFGWMAMPFAWYFGGRLFGFTRAEALIFGLLSIAISDFSAFGLSLNAIAGRGLYTYLWGMLVFPIALGAVCARLWGDRTKTPLAIAMIALMLITHIFLAVLLALASFVAAVIEPRQIKERARALMILYLPAFLLVAFWFVPFLEGIHQQGGLPWKGHSEHGYPITELMHAAVTGAFFDSDRLPWLTILAAAGLVFAIVQQARQRRDPRARFLLVFGAASAFLFLGRTNLGWLYGLIPFHAELEVTRYLSGIQVAGLMAAALLAGAYLPRAPLALALAIAVFAFDRAQTTYDRLNLVEAEPILRSSSGRLLAHRRLNTFDHVHLNLIPALSKREAVLSYGRGYHDSRTVYYLDAYDFSDEETRLFRITHAIATGSVSVPTSWSIEETHGDTTIYATGAPRGRFDFIRAGQILKGDPKQLRPAIAEATQRSYPRHQLPLINHDAPTTTATTALTSRVLEEKSAPNQYEAQVDVRAADERVLLSVSHHAYWHAYVDDRETPIAMTGPNLMSIAAPPGVHAIRFRYRNPTRDKVLFVCSLLALPLFFAPIRKRIHPRAV